MTDPKSGRARKQRAGSFEDALGVGGELRLGWFIRRIFRLLQQSLSRRLVDVDLSVPEYLILLELWNRDNVTHRDIATRVGITSASAVPTIDSLEQRGFLKRVQNTSDRRKVNLCLTDQGRDSAASLAEIGKSVSDVSLGAIPPLSRDELLSCLGRIVVALENESNGSEAE